MIIKLKSKICDIKVTGVDASCSGSIEIDSALMKMAGIVPDEQVHVLNVSNGERFITYAIGGKGIHVYGAAAKLVEVGDELIILSYHLVDGGSNSYPKIVSWKC